MRRSIVSISALIAVMWALGPQPSPAQQLESIGDGFRATITQTFSVGPGGSLRIDEVTGGITVTAWDRNQVEVREIVRLEDYSRSEAESYLKEHASSFGKSGNTVTVRGPHERNWGWRSNRVQRNYEARVPREFSVDARTAGGGIHVSGVTGAVDVRTSGGGINIDDITGNLTARTSGGGLNLTNIDGAVDAQTSGGGINVERVTGQLDVRTSGGGIDIQNVGRDVEARTSGGGVSIEQVGGSVRARTAGGDMEMRNIDQTVDVETSGGDIDLIEIGGRISARTSGGDIEGRALGGRVEAETSAGDIELDDVRGGVQARTSVGDIEIGLTVQDFDTDYATGLRTSHGDISLTLPPDLPASIDAEVHVRGGWDRNDIYSDFALSRETPGDDRSGTLRSYGDINGGGPAIELRTSGGSIRIKKSNQ